MRQGPMSAVNDPSDPDGAGHPATESARGTRRHGWVRRKPVITLMVALGAILVSVSIWLALSTSPTADSAALSGPFGAPAPRFSLPSLSNQNTVLSLTTFRGRPLVINFWASWCGPCRTEMPLLERAFRAEDGKVAFLGVDSNDTASAALAFLTKVHVTYPAVSDPNASLATRFGLFGLPTTVFISPTGKIVGRHIGELQADTLRAALHEAFDR
jgi:cytochrome c biogenesis protein CcmG, thiol:disulfide interchange protein DsbE